MYREQNGTLWKALAYASRADPYIHVHSRKHSRMHRQQIRTYTLESTRICKSGRCASARVYSEILSQTIKKERAPNTRDVGSSNWATFTITISLWTSAMCCEQNCTNYCRRHSTRVCDSECCSSVCIHSKRKSRTIETLICENPNWMYLQQPFHSVHAWFIGSKTAARASLTNVFACV